MKIVSSLSEIKEANGFVATVGNFDGVHVGHQAILKSIKEDASNSGRKMAVITFVPHPLSILKPKDHFLLNSYNERREMLRFLGIDYLLEINFTRDFSTLPPEEFLREFILTNKSLKKIFVGYDFAFGANKSGDYKFLSNYCAKLAIDVSHLNEFVLHDSKVSSSAVRTSVLQGEMENAAALLGRRFYLRGRVTKGEGRGRQLSFPTANLEYSQDRIVPLSGVYITEVVLKSGRHRSVTNIGFNPTFNSDHLTRVETHVLDFDEDIYGESIDIVFHKRLRAEKKFNGIDELVKQISEDVEQSREYFKC